MADLKVTINGLDVRLQKADRALDIQEQYFRRNCLLIPGISKENQKHMNQVVINILKKKICEEITHQDIDSSHRLGNQKPDKNKPWCIVMKFLRYKGKAKIFKNKQKLKGKWISVTKSLTKTRMEQLQKAREEHSF